VTYFRDGAVPVPHDRGRQTFEQPVLFDAVYDGESVRGAVFSLASPMLDRAVAIIVVETRHKRNTLVRDIQIGMVLFMSCSLAWGILFFIMASLGYTGSLVFYNSYLPEIAAPADQDRVSARGYTFGYIGSVLMQLIGFGLVLMMPDSKLPLKITFLLD